MEDKSFVIVPQFPKTVHLVSIFSLCCSDWVISVGLSSGSVILPSVHSAVALIRCLLFQFIVFFSIEISISFFIVFLLC